MTGFEQYLISLGYVKHKYNFKTMKNEMCDDDSLSTIGNIDFRYIHPVLDETIVFGLREVGRPPTLISPLPRIKVIRDEGIQDEQFCESVDLVLQKVPFVTVLYALFHKEIVFTFDRRTKKATP